MAEKKTTKNKKPGFGARTRKFFRDTASEFKKVVWPTRKQVINNTVVILTTVVFFAIVVWLLDLGFGWARQFLIDTLSGGA